MMLNVAIDRRDKPGCYVSFKDHMYRTPEIRFAPRNSLMPPKEYAVSAVHHLDLSDVMELVFLESLRRQLAQYAGDLGASPS
jgi:hypothetical protein